MAKILHAGKMIYILCFDKLIVIFYRLKGGICPQNSVILAELIGMCWKLLITFNKFLLRPIIRDHSEGKQM